MKILAIETSCDETAVCLIEADGCFGPDVHFEVLRNALLSQVAVHAPYGGVFPNLAKREHARNLVPLLQQVLPRPAAEQGSTLNPAASDIRHVLEREPELFEQLDEFLKHNRKPDIDAIAVTHGPGLEPALWVGVNFAKALSAVWDIPIVPVNHLEGHIAMAMVESADAIHYRLKTIHFPAVALLISGGHTELDLVESWPDFKTIGETRDDAVGEAFDKVARMMGLPYPGGPEISRLAGVARADDIRSSEKLPRPMMHEPNFDFSFSGLKTAVLRLIKNRELTEAEKMALAREFEDAAADVLIHKTMRAVEEYGAQTAVVGGGVSANAHIKSELKNALEKIGVQLLTPAPELATDNALMIALAGYFRARNHEFVDPDTLRANGNLRLGHASA
jgi:N6-L-threonylcarbamoyladenine synthase